MRLAREAPCGQAVALGLGLLAVVHLAAAGWMLLAADSFVHAIGPVGGTDGHDVGTATVLAAAQSAGLAVALVRPGWRTGVLTISIAVLGLLTADRWVEITGRTVPAMEDQPAHVVVEVRDNGLGVPVDQRDRLFERFFRAGVETVTGVEGTGLGLSIVRETVESLGGRAWAEFPDGMSVFAFSLPTRRADDPTPNEGLPAVPPLSAAR